MNVTGVLGLEIAEEYLALCAGTERQSQLEIRALQPAGFILGKALHHAREQRIGRLEAGSQKVLQAVLDFARKEGAA